MRRRAEGTCETNGSIDAKSTMRVRLHARSDLVSEHPTQQRTPTRVDPDDLPAPVDLGDLNLVGDNDATAHQVDEVARQQVFGEEDLAGTSLETTKVDSPALEGHATLGESANLLDRHEEVSTLDTDDGAHDGRVRIVAETRDQVLDASNLVAVRVVDRTVQERREVENLSHGYGFQHPKPTASTARSSSGRYRRANALGDELDVVVAHARVRDKSRPRGETVPPSTPSALSWRTTRRASG